MFIEAVFHFSSNYLVEFMGALLIVGLVFRWATYKSSKLEDAYFSSFTSEVDKFLANRQNGNEVEDVDAFLEDIFHQVSDKLPTRSVRYKKKEERKDLAKKLGAKNVVSLREYVSGEKSLFHSIRAESGAFKSKFPPNYGDLTDRILTKDDQWNKLLNFFPVGPISRLNDVLPTVFVVLGIFGTFIGISMALPEIAEMDFANLEGAGDTLKTFVLKVTFAMKTSIAGILFSLIMTFLNTLAPVRGTREKTFKKVANCFENIWISLHAQITMEQRLSETMPALLKEVQDIKKEMEKVQQKKVG